MKRFVYILIGAAVPLATYFVCRKVDLFGDSQAKRHREKLQEIAVEDSFPASDPPSTW
ncbi:MAG: hypothetical protein JOY54_18305 [Acidobacteriaceae bacterium]|nr:hypothetical protein [Acidobacteriaceae bacterium]